VKSIFVREETRLKQSRRMIGGGCRPRLAKKQLP
jgi:hypothetical protein